MILVTANAVYQLWELFYGRGLFDIPPDSRGSGSVDGAHLGQIISLLGVPPPDLLGRGKETSCYFDDMGQLKCPGLVMHKNIVSMAGEIGHDDDLPGFVDFLSAMLRWRPEDRTTAEDLVSHPWLSHIPA